MHCMFELPTLPYLIETHFLVKNKSNLPNCLILTINMYSAAEGALVCDDKNVKLVIHKMSRRLTFCRNMFTVRAFDGN